MQLESHKVQDAAASVEEYVRDLMYLNQSHNPHRTLKNLHKHVLRFAIYGRPKAFINREEISGFFEGFNIEMDKVLKSFAVSCQLRLDMQRLGLGHTDHGAPRRPAMGRRILPG
jgi:hypothetical protein